MVVQEYAPLLNENYKILGENFTGIYATARPDNPPSIKLLLTAGMNKIDEKPKWGQLRHFFFVNTIDLIKFPNAPVCAPRPGLI